ncbi:hypothetical protein QYE76_031806 [Lolium multiflorum]|uniref:Reverse transcriptase Ty1/copia-type domain-containing protein n=1 Tax=Lolium multiflorum TaxID=4521 RepID=A0AAD8VKR9_LOLMU|nr:hypothetical protein QYE76_031806 [Lolium multiflorum]
METFLVVKYLADLKSGLVKKKKGISDIHVIDVYLTGSRTSAWSSAVPEDVPVPPAPVTEEANDNDHETSSEVATEPRRSTRERTTPDWYDPCLNLMIVDNNDEDPATYEEAMMSPDSNKWQEAMKSEMGSMYDNKVWTLVDLPDSRKAVENKWIFKRKTDADGNVTVYKARLVAKGFRQIQGVDYDETFSPVAKLKSVRILLAIAAFFDYEIWQMDVKMAFLNGDIEEELYMVQPKGFVDPKNADKVLEGSRKVRKKRTMEGGVPEGLHNPGRPNPKGGVPDLGYNSWGFHLYNEGQGEGAGHPKHHKLAAPLAGTQTLAASPNPSRLLLHRNSRIRLGEALPEFSITTATTPSCCRDSEEDLLLPLPAGMGRRTSSSSTPNV